MSNVGRHKERVGESHAWCRCAEAVKAGSVLFCIGCAAGKSNSFASFKASAVRLFGSCGGHWQFVKASNTRLSEPPWQGLSSSGGAGAGAPPRENVGQSVGAAAQRRSAQPWRHRVERQRGRWRSNRTSLVHQSDAVGTGITPRPPHRSVRAELPHTAPASGANDQTPPK